MSGSSNGASRSGGTPRPSTVAELLLAGSDLGHLLERLVRRRSGLSLAQFNALRILKGREPGSAQASDLTRGLRISSAHATTLLQQLEERGLIARGEDASDRRRRPVRLSPRGQTALAEALPALLQLEDRLTDTLGDDHASKLWSDLRTVRMIVGEAIAADDLDCVGP